MPAPKAAPPLPVLREVPQLLANTQQFLNHLEAAGFRGMIATDYAQRVVAATDNSIYQMLPQAILYPRSHADIVAIMTTLKNHGQALGISLTPRGGGTGTNGQALGNSLILDTSKYLTTIGACDLAQGTITVGPGVVLDDLNRHLQTSHGRFFAPDLSPSSRATIGGMCSTDACGKGSRIYGRTSDHIASLKLVTNWGDTWQITHHNVTCCDPQPAAQQRLAAICAALATLCRDHQDEITARFPQLSRFMTGYNLKKLFTTRGLDLIYLICGSEGTLGVISEITVYHRPIPKHKCLFVLKYPSFAAALAGAQDLLKTAPLAIETIDETILNLAQQDTIWHHVAPYFAADSAAHAPTKAINLVEYVSDTTDGLAAATAQMHAYLATCQPPVAYNQEHDPRGMNHLWQLRKRGVGLLGNRAGARRPLPFVEDTAVPPEHLAAYIADFRQILDSEGLDYGMFGHVDVGCLHVRPALNLQDPADQARVRRISDQVKNLTLKYRGLFWAEHGRGLRSEYTQDFFGPQLFAVLKAVKSLFDPDNLLNPGKIVTPQGWPTEVPALDATPFKGALDSTIPPAHQQHFAAAMFCNGNAQCLSTNPHDVMCPSAKPGRDRLHSPKGRAMLIREWTRLVGAATNTHNPANHEATGTRPRGEHYDFSHEVYDALSTCLSCKACTHTCPIKVDIPEVKSRFLSLYHSRYRRPLADYFLAYGEVIHQQASRFALIANLAMTNPLSRWLMAQALGIVHPPQLSSPPTGKLLARAGIPILSTSSLPQLATNAVIIIQDAMTSFYDNPVLLASCQLLQRWGYKPYVAPFFVNGKGFHVKGMRRAFARAVANASRQLRILAGAGVPLLGIEPAFTFTYREEYTQGEATIPKVWQLQEFLATVPPPALPQPPPSQDTYALLLHCQEQAALPTSGQDWQSLFAACGHELQIINRGCCGMAGMFGHEKRQEPLAKTIFADGWQGTLAALKSQGIEPLATGGSCREQAQLRGHGRLRHPAEVLAGNPQP